MFRRFVGLHAPGLRKAVERVIRHINQTVSQ